MIGAIITISGFIGLCILCYNLGKLKTRSVNFTASEIKDIIDLYIKEREKFDVFFKEWDYKKCKMIYEDSDFGHTKLKLIEIRK